MTDDWSSIPGWTCDDMLALYDEAARKYPDGTFVEVGVAYGRSLAYLATRLGSPRRDVLGVDTWNEFMGGDNLPPAEFARMRAYGSPLAAATCELGRVGAGVRALYRGTSARVARGLWAGFGEFDFVFIDANHTYESVCEDICAWLPLMRPGGILAGHDYSPDLFPGVCRAVDELLPERTIHGVVWRVDMAVAP